MRKFFIVTGIIGSFLTLLCIGGFFIVKDYYFAQITEQTSNSTQIQFTITQGESIVSIVSDLKAQGIYTNPFILTLYLKLNKLDSDIEAGTYTIPPHIQLQKLATMFQKANSPYATITILEGVRLEEQAALIDKQLSVSNPNKKFDQQAFIDLAKHPNGFSYPFMKEIPNSVTTLEGFLFPDTYQVYKDVDARKMLSLMLVDFQTKIYTKYKTDDKILSFYQMLTLASILEREAKTDTDMRMIADIMIRRYQQNYPLGLDTTIEYGLGFSQTEQTWWRTTLYQTDLDTDTPYNTRTHPGFPPTPISNPGENAIVDALNPLPNTYFYFLADSNGVIHYAHTIDEHNANIQKYLH